MTHAVYFGTVVFITGMLAADKLHIPLGYSAGAVLLLILGCVFFFKPEKRCLPVALLIFALLGIAVGSRMEDTPQKILQPYYQQEVTACGVIDPLSVKSTEYGSSFILKCRVINAAGKTISYQHKLRVFSRSKNISLDKYILCRGRLQPLSSFRNPGGFNGELWNQINGIGGMISKSEIVALREHIGIWDNMALYNAELREKITAVTGKDTGAVLAGMVLGGSSGVDEQTRKIFMENGLTHILSVSGTHMVLLTGFILLLLKKIRRQIRFSVTAAVLLLYAALCGFSPPVLRALAMSFIVLYGEDKAEKGVILCITGVILLIFKPLWLYDIGFQLSFGAAAGLIWLLPKIKQVLSAYLHLWLSEAVGVTVAAQLAVLPLLVDYFHQLSVISIISNIILVPVLEMATIMTLAGVLFSSITGLGDNMLMAAAFLVKQVIVQARFLGALPGSILIISTMPMWLIWVYYFFLMIALDLPCMQFLKNKERRAFIVGLSLILIVWLGMSRYGESSFAAYFLDVGQGDCAVIVTPDRKVAVIDTGGLKNYDTRSRIVIPFLYSIGKSEIDILLLSHGDYDHAGGAAGLAGYAKINKVIIADTVNIGEAEKALLAVSDAVAERAVTGSKYRLGDDTFLEIVAGSPPEAEGNESSIISAVKYQGHRVLFTGDIDEDREASAEYLPEADVLKVAHHGSRYSSSEEFLAAVKPRLAVISSGLGNSYGHPHQETLERLRRAGCQIMRTDTMGAIKVTFDDARTKCYSYVYQKEYF